MYRALIVSLMVVACVPTSASAQRRVQYDTLAESTPAAVSCGFCQGEKFGMLFRELPGGLGLRASEFPLTVRSVEVAVGRSRVTGSILEGGYSCEGSTEGGTVNMPVEIYTGMTAPSNIMAFPASGPWPGETLVYANPAAPLEVSVEMTAGSAMYNVMFNTIELPDGGVRVDPPNTYLRVVVGAIPAGANSTACEELGLTPPAAVGIRDDDGRIDSRIGMILSVGGFGDGWYWNEDVTDQSGNSLNGDWGIRVNVTPLGTTTPDAGTPSVDAGTDAGPTPVMDSGVPVMDSGTPTPMCAADSECAGGERCVEGMCQRVSCSAAADCAGGMTCVEGMCRNLCTSSSECLGGEVCDTEAGHCVPVGSEDSGCGCRTVGSPRSGAGVALVLMVLGAIVMRRRR